jgi:hypothetical protein
MSFLVRISTNFPTSNTMKLRPLKCDLFFQDRRKTDRQTKLIVAFRNVTYAPNIKCVKHLCKISTQTDTFWPQRYILPIIYLVSVNTVISNGAVRNITVCDIMLPPRSSCSLLGYCAGSVGNFLQTFRDNLSVPSSRGKLSQNVDKNLPLLAT